MTFKEDRNHAPGIQFLIRKIEALDASAHRLVTGSEISRVANDFRARRSLLNFAAFAADRGSAFYRTGVSRDL